MNWRSWGDPRPCLQCQDKCAARGAVLSFHWDPRRRTEAGPRGAWARADVREARVLARVLVLEQGLGLLLADDGGFHLRGVHVHVQLPAHQQAHGGCKLGLGLQDLRGLLLNDECAVGTQVTRCCLRRRRSGPSSTWGGCLEWGSAGEERARGRDPVPRETTEIWRRDDWEGGAGK